MALGLVTGFGGGKKVLAALSGPPKDPRAWPGGAGARACLLL